jgi:NADH:ubiquinone reductase (H+-translocating)
MENNALFAHGGGRSRVLIVGGGFAGFTCAHELEKRLGPDDAELLLVSPTDYLLYSPLLPEVAAGTIDPRHIAVPLHGHLRRTRVVLGYAVGVNLEARTLTVASPDEPADGTRREIGWDRLVLAPGAVTRTFPIPGLEEKARGFKTLAEALYLRDHILKQLDCADASDDEAERRARLTFVVVGAGYAGTEFAAQAQLFAKRALRNYPSLRPGEMRWLLVDIAPQVLPELGEHLGEVSLRVLSERGIEIRLGASVESITERGLTLSDGTFAPTYTLVWCAGAAASPLVSTLGLPLQRGRLVVDEYLAVAGRPDVFALGDCAAVPDLTRPGQITPPTAQHALRQGRTAARNVAASLGRGRWRSYRHNDLGLVVDLGAKDAAAKPLGVELSGVVAKVVTRAYHLYALSSTPQRVRVGLDWILDAVLPRPLVRLGIGKEEDAALAAAEHTDIYEDLAAAPESGATVADGEKHEKSHPQENL